MLFSVLTSIYKKNTIIELDRCFDSIRRQCTKPNEIILVVDGPIEEDIFTKIEHWKQILPIKCFALPKNQGLAAALNYGLDLCACDWVFRIDIDDVCADDRFKIQTEFILNQPSLHIVGGNIECFTVYPQFFPGRKVPLTNKAIRRFSKYRNPLNHPTVAFKKDAILEIGGYPAARLGQDYLLWVEALRHGLDIQNCTETLVYMQVDNNTYARRGLSNFLFDCKPYFQMKRYGITNSIELFIGVVARMGYCALCSLRSMVK